MKHLLDDKNRLLISWEEDDLSIGELMKLSFLCWCRGVHLDDCETIDEDEDYEPKDCL